MQACVCKCFDACVTACVGGRQKMHIAALRRARASENAGCEFSGAPQRSGRSVLAARFLDTLSRLIK